MTKAKNTKGEATSYANRLPQFTYEIKSEGRSMNLVLKCAACEGPSGILNSQCMSVVTNILTTEPYVDTITITGAMERQYVGDSVRFLKTLVALTKLIEQFSLRSPHPFTAGLIFPDGQVDGVIAELEAMASGPGVLPGPLLSADPTFRISGPKHAADVARHLRSERAAILRVVRHLDCPNCPYNPRTMFPAMNRALLSGYSGFDSDLRAKALALSRGTKEEGCTRCLASSASDFVALSEKLVELEAHLRLSGRTEGEPAEPAADAKGEA
jgi:hypothetical protein